MRISDWSSDVCSSDLRIASYGLKVGSFVAPIWDGAGGGSAMGSVEDRKRFVSQVRKAAAIGQQMRELGIRPTGDRKSVVEGKSGSVRVDLGGRRIIKKKNVKKIHKKKETGLKY